MSYRTNLVAFRIPKPGEGIEDCQDSLMADPDRLCFALSDGVSRSFLPGLWSRMLVEYLKSISIFDTKFENNHIDEWFDPLLKLWDCKVQQHFGKPLEQLPYYVRNNLQKPAYATLAVLELRPKVESGEILDWKAIAIGDTCVFHFREDRLLKVVPAINSTEFSNYPVVIPCKKNELEQRLADYEIPTYSGEAFWNDRFYLATDALAKWILAQDEGQNYGAIRELLTIDDPIEFQNWVIQHRNEKGRLQLEGDDTSFISITIDSHYKDSILQPDGWPTLEESLKAEIAAQSPLVAEELVPSPPVDTLPEISNEPDVPTVLPEQEDQTKDDSSQMERGNTIEREVTPQGETEQVKPACSSTIKSYLKDSLLMRFWAWLTSLFKGKRDKRSRIQSV